MQVTMSGTCHRVKPRCVLLAIEERRAGVRVRQHLRPIVPNAGHLDQPPAKGRSVLLRDLASERKAGAPALESRRTLFHGERLDVGVLAQNVHRPEQECEWRSEIALDRGVISQLVRELSKAIGVGQVAGGKKQRSRIVPVYQFVPVRVSVFAPSFASPCSVAGMLEP